MFKLEPTIFRLQEAIDFITEMFARKMEGKNVKLTFEQVYKLQDPEDIKLLPVGG